MGGAEEEDEGMEGEEFNRPSACRNSNLTNSKLKVVCSVLDLEKKGTHADLVERIMSFLLAPKNSGKVSQSHTHTPPPPQPANQTPPRLSGWWLKSCVCSTAPPRQEEEEVQEEAVG